MNQELPNVQVGFRKGRGTRDQIANIHWIIEKAREFQKNIYFCFIEYVKALTVWITANCGKFWNRWEYQTTLSASWEICMQVKKQLLELDMEQQTGSKLRSIRQGCILSPCLFNFYAEYIVQNAGLDEAHTRIRIARRIISKLRYTDDTTLMAEREEEMKSLLMKVKEENEKAGLKLNIRKMKIMASGPITSWQIDGEIMETERDFIFGGGSKIIADGDCIQEIKWHLLLERKAMTNLDSILKSRDITLPTKLCLVKAMVFPVIMYGCKSWTLRRLSIKEWMLLNCGVGEDS